MIHPSNNLPKQGKRNPRGTDNYSSLLTLDVSGASIGDIASSKLSRIGVFDNTYFVGMCFELSGIKISLPPSPQDLGYDYSVSQYRELSGGG